MSSSQIALSPRARRARLGGWVVPALVVVGLLLIVGLAFGLRALLKQPDGGPAAARRAAGVKKEAFHWPIKDPTGPGQGTVEGPLKEGERLAVVGDVRAEEWKPNDEVRFIDAQDRVTGHGAVRAIIEGKLHVEYDAEPDALGTITAGDRALRTGKTRPAPQTAPEPQTAPTR